MVGGFNLPNPPGNSHSSHIASVVKRFRLNLLTTETMSCKFDSFMHFLITIIIIIMGLESVSASEDVIGDLNQDHGDKKRFCN